MSEFKVRFTQLRKLDKQNFILNKVYEVKNGIFIDETGHTYTKWLENGNTFESLKKWFEDIEGTKVELVEEYEIQNNKFTLSDLKDGMVITYRNGKSRYIFKKNFRGIDTGVLSGNTYNDYNDDLTHGSNYNEDIVRSDNSKNAKATDTLK